MGLGHQRGEKEGGRGGGSCPSWASPGRKRGEGGERAGGGKLGQQARMRKGGERRRNSFLFSEPIFQIRFQRVFESFWHLGQNQTS